jgi:succinate-acetate transporter protein
MPPIDAADVNAQVAAKQAKTRGLSVVALGLTLVLAATYVLGAAIGKKPIEWPSLSLLVTLFCLSISAATADLTVKRVVNAAGILFALGAIYGLLIR